MIGVEPGALVVLCCLNPKEQIWGQLMQLDACGVVVRGLDLGSVDDWLRQERSGEPALIVPSSVFVPMHRVQRLYCDESSDHFTSYGDRYRNDCGREVRDVLTNGLVVGENPGDES